MSFWDVEDAKPEFIFEDEKRKLIENMDYLMTMTVEEQTLYNVTVYIYIYPRIIHYKLLFFYSNPFTWFILI